MCVGSVGPELDGHGAEDAKLACHLVHPAQGPLFIRVGKLHYKAGGRTLRTSQTSHHHISQD